MAYRLLPLLVFLAFFSTGMKSVPAAEINKHGSNQAEFFEKHVRPVLAENCFACHGPGKQKGGLRLDSRAGLLAGGDSGPAMVTGNPDSSRLIQAIRYSGDLRMPP